jgi:hypothetical protein
MNENNCENHENVVMQKTARKKPVGSFYHPTEETYRDGKCSCGYVSKKGHQRHAYDRKDGTHVKHTYVHRTCIPNKGAPGKIFDNLVPVKIKEENFLKSYNYKTSNNPNTRFNKLLEACKEINYKTVVLELSKLITLTKNTEENNYLIYDEDLKKLKKWRNQNPDLYKQSNKKINIHEKNICNIKNCTKNHDDGKLNTVSKNETNKTISNDENLKTKSKNLKNKTVSKNETI